MSEINVKSLAGDYPVIIKEGSLDRLPSLIEGKFNKALILTDTNVHKYHSGKIIFLQKSLNAQLLLLAPGEKTKSIKSVHEIISFLSSKRFSRDSVIIAIGGGVIGDIAGFAASIYMRGINLIHIPTTLLSCVDSSVGGKTGINYNKIKNLIGTFYNPRLVLTDPDFLSTLPDREFNSGMGEVVKYAFLTGGELYKNSLSLNTISKQDTSSLCRIITSCLLFKASIIREDEKDTGTRQLLNFGHTFAHAYESASKFRLPHGTAVTYGIISSLFLSEALKLISVKEREEYLRLPQLFLPARKPNFDEKEMISFMLMDKKIKADNINFVLLKEPGTFLTNVKATRKEILSSIKKTFML